MDFPPLTSPAPPGAPPPVPPATSLAARLLNVFATPGEVFAEVAVSPQAARNWIVPTLIACAVSVVSVVILFSQPAIQQKIREQQQAAINQNVKAGKMTQQQADETIALVQKFASPLVLKLGGSVSAIIWAFASLFLWAFGLWLLALRVFKAEITYFKAVEVVALAGMISVLQEIVNLLLRVNLSNPSSSASLALMVGEIDPQNPFHLVLAMLDLFVIWHLIVLSIGFAKLARLPLNRVLFIVALLWLVLRIMLIAVSVLGLKLAT